MSTAGASDSLPFGAAKYRALRTEALKNVIDAPVLEAAIDEWIRAQLDKDESVKYVTFDAASFERFGGVERVAFYLREEPRSFNVSIYNDPKHPPKTLTIRFAE